MLSQLRVAAVSSPSPPPDGVFAAMVMVVVAAWQAREVGTVEEKALAGAVRAVCAGSINSGTSRARGNLSARYTLE